MIAYTKQSKAAQLAGAAKGRAARVANLQARIAERLWSRVSCGGPNDCWEWTGPTNNMGYGYIGHKGRQWYAHRLALTLSDNDWDSQINVLHQCDNPRCCNPAHLRRGTQLENLTDMRTKGRQVNAQPKGAAHGMAQLTTEQVEAIRNSTESAILIGTRYGISRNHVWRIRTGKNWRQSV